MTIDKTKCNYRFCPYDALFEIHFICCAEDEEVLARMALPLFVCAAHRDVATKDELIDRSWFGDIRQKFVDSDRKPPELKQSKVELVPLTSSMFLGSIPNAKQ